MYYIALLAVIAYIAYTIRDGRKTLSQQYEYRKHVEHIKAIFVHERNRAIEFKRSKIKHWSIGCDELRQSTMLEE